MTEKQKEFKPQTPDQDVIVIDKRHAAHAPAVQDDSPNALVMMAMQKGYTPELIKEMMALQREHKADIAKEAFNADMAKWAAVAPEITKDRKVSFQTTKGTTEYSHPTLPNVSKSINDSMSPFGLKASWRTEQPDGQIRVTCIVSHKLGHSESTSLVAPSDVSGSKNPIQAMGSTISYLERYTLLALTGLAAHDTDDDGNAAGQAVECITEDQAIVIDDLIKETGANEKLFLKWVNVTSVREIPATSYDAVISELNRKKKKTRKPGEEG